MRLTVALFDGYLRQLVPHALRGLALASWANRFQRLAPLAEHESGTLAVRIEELRELSPVMADVRAARKQHLFFSSYALALEELAEACDVCDGLYAASGAWSMACRRLQTFLEPRDTMRDAFQAVIDEERPFVGAKSRLEARSTATRSRGRGSRSLYQSDEREAGARAVGSRVGTSPGTTRGA